MEAHVSFRGRKPVPQHVDIGMERENKVTVLCFEGLPKMDGSTAYLHIDLGKNSDAIEIIDGQADVTRTITQFTGSVEAFVEVLGANDRVWHSQIMELFVGRLPLLGEKIEQEYPTAFEQALAQTAADKTAAAKSAADAAATAAGIVTEEAARQDAERKRVAAETARENAEGTRAEKERLRASAEGERVKAEAARETAEANREQAEAAREQETAEALASVAGVENAVRANEQQRVQEEQHRETAETARAEAERQRKSTETSRQTAESARNTAESGRVTAETARADAEGKRVQAEQGRVTAEQGRVEAEAQREETMAQHAEKIAELENEVEKKAQIDDTTVSDATPWSSQHIVDMLCPPLEESGNPVVCYPVAGSKLGIKMSWEPTQEGTGTPYPAGGGPNLLDMAQCMPTVGKPYGLTITIDGDIIKASGIPSSEVTEEGQYSFSVASCAQTELRGKGYKVTAFAIKGKISSAWGLRTESEDSLAISAKLTPGVNTDIQFRLMVSKDTPTAYAPYANIRPIRGRNSVSITRQEDELSMMLTLPSTIYGGEVNAVTGEGLWFWRLITLDGTENWKRDSSGGTAFICNVDGIENRAENSKMVCSHAAWGSASPTANYRVNTIAYTLYLVWPNADGDAVKLRELLAAQYDAGTPVQVAYKIATPVPFTATGGGTIKALSGINTILTDADTLTVTGRTDPIHIIQQLQAASAASAQALADVERAVTDI